MKTNSAYYLGIEHVDYVWCTES